MPADIVALIEKVKRDPEFLALERRRSRLAWGLSAAMAAIYFGFILVVAFAPGLLATPIGTGTTTIGIPLGVGVILAAFVLTGFYVWRANKDFDLAVERIVGRHT
ncbi:DUF485 domain-containing protein [uncultured Hyphomicrobium sp.]|uniref:DUF485 domain-containing protein n=1 Tax=uncultured Hyphomicrobium sp. TaxID=194373 RepID=UPI0025DBFA26|nr:DUF485 domain-containing protein [uncultured Hyphomicrobium sp.]